MDKQEFERQAKNELAGNGKSNFGTSSSAGQYTDVPFGEAKIARNICDAYQWLNDNSGYLWETYGVVDVNGGRIGIRAIKEGGIVINIEVPTTGGDNGDPIRQFKIDNNKLLMKAVEYVTSNNTELH